MSVDMGESLVFSYLKHVKECQIVQTNWKIDTKEVAIVNGDSNIKEKYITILETINNTIKEGIFNSDNLEQILKQGECDVIGIKTDNKTTEIYAADIAFHRARLGYKDNFSKVIQKSTRTAICVYQSFKVKKAIIIFATPKISDEDKINIEKGLKDVEIIINENLNVNFSFELLSGELFKNSVLDEVHNLWNKINDVNEYFLRCYQLEKIFEPKTSKTDNKTFETMIINDEIEYNNDYSQEPIGVYANTTFRNALIKITDKNIVEKLTNKQYCSEIFKLNFPLLSSKRKDEKGRNRYYKQEIRILGTTYYLCSQWYEKSRKYIEVWIQQNCN